MKMTRKVREIQDLVIDEISLVDKGANQHATVTIAKSADGEKENYMDIYDEQGNPLDPDALEIGDVVYDATGDAYEIQADDDTENEVEYEQEPELAVAKSFTSPFTKREQRQPVTKGFAEGLREELSKALTDRDRDEVINKAFSQIEILSEATEIAKRAAEEERDIRLTQEYVEIAKSYDLPGLNAEQLGETLKHAAEKLSYEDCEVIGKALAFASDAGNVLYEEIGSVGGGDNSDVLAMVNAHVDGYVAKGANYSREELVSEVFGQNPEAYDQYLAERG
jgi:hypothetical protein